jgi:hypothetical protein
VSPRRRDSHPTQPHLTMTEQEQIDQLYTLVYLHSHRDELLQIMCEQIQDDSDICIAVNLT